MKAPNIKPHLAKQIWKNRSEVSRWYIEKASTLKLPLYTSIDLRDSGYKIAPVDSNLFPAGFNNICPEDLRTAPAILRTQIEAMSSQGGWSPPKRVLVIPESHTQNRFYIENLYYLLQILRDAGFEVALGWYDDAKEPVHLLSATEKELVAQPLLVQGGRVRTAEIDPDFVILNNDFSSGYPKRLEGISQPILPDFRLGWHSRKKSTHFLHYNNLAQEFAELIDIDPWSIQVDSVEVDAVDFSSDQGMDRVQQVTAEMFERLRKEHEKRGISNTPFAFVKNNSGTYGMGILVVHNIEELATMNRRTKNKMSVGKNKQPIQSVVVQEGIPTTLLVDRLAAEPVIYLSGIELIGGFLRTNPERGTEDNLNSQGMVFRKLCMTDLREEILGADTELKSLPLLELVYGSIARLSALAAAKEAADLSSCPRQ